jgi:phage/plasmid-like protein (TIGR03299 family)
LFSRGNNLIHHLNNFFKENIMAHMIDTTTGKAAMAYVGSTPWHGLGQAMEADASIDQWVQAAGMDFEIQQAGVQFVGKDNSVNLVSDKKVLYRGDTGKHLSVVGKDYKVVQPRQVLEFFKNYVGPNAQIETAGVLREGRHYWALARLEGDLNLAGDITRPYLMLATSADGSLATQARLTSVRVVCNNTLTVASKGTADATLRHNSAFSETKLTSKLNDRYASLASHYETMRLLAQTKVDNDKAAKMLAKLVDLPDLPKGFVRVMDLFNGQGLGSESEAAKGTAFGLVQAFTQFADWEAGRGQDARLFNAWFGQNDKLKTKLVGMLAEAA